MARARVHITFKEGILDPQGKTVLRALKSLGYDEVEELRVGKYMELELAGEDRARLEERLGEMCEKLLANPIIEDYDLEVDA
ncbi:MAG: phosphoribosylformylglycinamidine synthase subunit PurS [Actinobacteria bacterium]|nr:phosphoribosylformylglycinamidine synthase subunit PurS [Actinomycetota bacterium]MCG2794490.1 phosphoribosylformylglycinamidine synthase subunit PurS [Actinomycetes bacterium]MBU4240039.1 phosphoribosylformylglycinamidine synthase subunit PurS [Actinomycetota bacterium]MBU4301649.1 phosphoribosylformylglycinamidine synthase subunit PurS [Actinomycetota bacterium]MBU4386547.1 phosphoribosylformylglycinamidine synthase subunit PurS [Actinomycetota bacterium]